MGHPAHTLRPYGSLVTLEVPIQATAFCPLGNYLAHDSGSALLLWQLDSGQLQILKAHRSPINSLAFSPDGKTLASASDDHTVTLWDLKTNHCMAHLKHPDSVYCVAFSPNGQWVASGDSSGHIYVWKSNPLRLPALRWRVNGTVYDMAFSAQELLACATNKGITLVKLHTPQPQILYRGASTRSLAFSPSGQTLAAVNSSQRTLVWDVATQKPYPPLKNAKGDFSKVTFAHEQLLAAGDDNGNITLYNPATTKLVATYQQHHQAILGLAFSANRRWMASSDIGGTLKLWQAEGPQLANLKPAPYTP